LDEEELRSEELELLLVVLLKSWCEFGVVGDLFSGGGCGGFEKLNVDILLS
jgi:hypothetical protein